MAAFPSETAALVRRWADSGAMALTGPPDCALGPPAPLVNGVERLGRRLANLDALALLGEREAILGLARDGAISCGGGCRLLPTADGWLALTLARPEDWGSRQAWLGLSDRAAGRSGAGGWAHVAAVVAGGRTADLVEQGAQLELPVAAVGDPPVRAWVRPVPYGPSAPCPYLAGRLVVDLALLVGRAPCAASSCPAPVPR